MGSESSAICLVGRNPGKMEDKKGIPFIGPAAGTKLDQGLKLAGIERSQCYITNLVKCYTPSGVVPSQRCQRTCANAWLMPELRTLKGLKLIVTYGNEALRWFEPDASVGDVHGTYWNHRCIAIFCSYHPSAALRNVKFGKRFISDMKNLGMLIKELDL